MNVSNATRAIYTTCNFLDQLLHPYKFYGSDMSGILFSIFASCHPFKVLGATRFCAPGRNCLGVVSTPLQRIRVMEMFCQNRSGNWTCIVTDKGVASFVRRNSLLFVSSTLIPIYTSLCQDHWSKHEREQRMPMAGGLQEVKNERSESFNKGLKFWGAEAHKSWDRVKFPGLWQRLCPRELEYRLHDYSYQVWSCLFLSYTSFHFLTYTNSCNMGSKGD